MSDPPTTEDGHFFVIDGRKWRATDPLVPDEPTARAGVQAAKVALGERGTPPWWEQAEAQRRARWEADVPVPDNDR